MSNFKIGQPYDPAFRKMQPSEIKDQLAAGNEVIIKGFGSFKITTRKERNGRNPQTGETMLIPEKKVVKFKSYF